MAIFRMKIAGAVAEVHSLFESTRDYCKAYLTEDSPDFTVTVTEQMLTFEQNFLLKEALEEGFKVRRFTDPFLERAAIQRAFAEYLFDRDVLLLHGSLVAVDGDGFLFCARSGTGKSTHTRYWREVFGSRAVMVNDDKPFFAVTDRGVLAYGAPWSGKHGLDANVCVPMKGICLLERGSENRIRRAEKDELLSMLTAQGCRPLNPGKQGRYYALAERFVSLVPLWHMSCTKDPEAARIAYGAMTAK